MHEIVLQLLGYLRGIWRFRWWVLGTAWAVSVVGWIMIAQIPDKYEASARVYVDTQSLLRPLLKGLAVRGNDQQRLLLMSKTLFSRPNLEKVMRMTDLDLQAKTDGDADAIIEGLRSNIKLQGTGRINLYTISYIHQDPELAKLVVKSFLTIFVEANLGDSRKEQNSARQFLEQQISDYEQRLVEAEGRRTRFKQKNIGFLEGKQGGYYSNLQATQSQLSEAELALKIQEDRLKVLQQQVEGEVPSFGIMQDEATMTGSSLDPRIENLESKQDELLLRYTERHPDVQAVKKTLWGLKKQREKELAAANDMAMGSPSPALSGNPVYQQMRISLSQAEAEVAAKQAVVSEYKKRIKDLESAVDRVLQVEAESAQLNRDYNILKKQHQQLLVSLESARLSQDVDIRSDSVRFRTVDPPRVPASPSWPPRELFSSAIVLVGLLAGVALAFLLSQMRPTYDNRRTLNELTDLPVLGSVSMIWTNAQLKERQRRHLGFLFGLFGLVSAYGLVMVTYLFELNLGDYLNKARDVAGI